MAWLQQYCIVGGRRWERGREGGRGTQVHGLRHGTPPCGPWSSLLHSSGFQTGIKRNIRRPAVSRTTSCLILLRVQPVSETAGLDRFAAWRKPRGAPYLVVRPATRMPAPPTASPWSHTESAAAQNREASHHYINVVGALGWPTRVTSLGSGDMCGWAFSCLPPVTTTGT